MDTARLKIPQLPPRTGGGDLGRWQLTLRAALYAELKRAYSKERDRVQQRADLVWHHQSSMKNVCSEDSVAFLTAFSQLWLREWGRSWWREGKGRKRVGGRIIAPT